MPAPVVGSTAQATSASVPIDAPSVGHTGAGECDSDERRSVVGICRPELSKFGTIEFLLRRNRWFFGVSPDRSFGCRGL